MRFPKMQAGTPYRVSVPALNGGVNLKDAPNLVEDNQLTDVKNMWWKDQALRTRPGLYTDEDKIYSVSDNSQTVFGIKDLHGVPTFMFEHLGEADFYRTAVEIGNSGDSYWASIKNMFYSGLATRPWNDSAGVTSSDPVNALYIDLSGNSAIGNYLLDQIGYSPDGMVFFSNGDIYCTPQKYDLPFVDMAPYIYAPLVLVNGMGATGTSDAAITGTLFEGYNLLTPRFRCKYTTDGTGIYFFLPQKNLDDSEITITLTTVSGSDLVFTIPAGSSTSQTLSSMSARISRTAGYFWFNNSSGAMAYSSVGFSSNVEITVSKSSVCDFYKICEMTFYTWYGGDANGINGGSRIFVGGNRNYPNLVHWSDVNNVLYFPENNYAYIGDTDNAVTAFGKQSDMLVIFKERELYYATYMAGASYTAQDVIDGKVVDVAANSAQFPIAQISSHTGCDCPGTIQLCNNRLVWATSEGKVYVLATANQYNERNAYEISGMIRSDLLNIQKEKWTDACAGDYCNHYALLVDNHMYLFDYGASAFVNASAYSRDENLQKNICWYKWYVEIEGIQWIHFMARDTRGILIGEYTHNSSTYNVLFTLEGTADIVPSYDDNTHDFVYRNCHISAYFQTKLFDFGHPDRRKFIRRLHIGATDTQSKYISISYITESGEYKDAYWLGVYGDGKMREWAVTPSVNRARQFGIRAESDGNMAVDNMVLKYEMNGEVR